MRKAKIMLMFILVFGIAGGLLAFKVKNYGSSVRLFSCGMGGLCNSFVMVLHGYTTIPINNSTQTFSTLDADSTKACSPPLLNCSTTLFEQF